MFANSPQIRHSVSVELLQSHRKNTNCGFDVTDASSLNRLLSREGAEVLQANAEVLWSRRSTVFQQDLCPFSVSHFSQLNFSRSSKQRNILRIFVFPGPGRNTFQRRLLISVVVGLSGFDFSSGLGLKTSRKPKTWTTIWGGAINCFARHFAHRYTTVETNAPDILSRCFEVIFTKNNKNVHCIPWQQWWNQVVVSGPNPRETDLYSSMQCCFLWDKV